MTTSKTAVGYTRLSQKSDTSIENQKANIREYCSEHVFELDRIYDDGQQASGWDGSREEYRELKHRMRTDDELDAVVLNDKRRIARDIDEVMRLIPDFREYNVELHTVMDGGKLDLGDPMKAAVEILMAAAAHEEKLKEIEKAIQITEDREADGYWAGEAPFGTEFGVVEEHGKRLVPKNGEWGHVLAVLRLRDQGASYREIERETGVPSATAWRICGRRAVYRAAAERAVRHGLTDDLDWIDETAEPSQPA